MNCLGSGPDHPGELGLHSTPGQARSRAVPDLHRAACCSGEEQTLCVVLMWVSRAGGCRQQPAARRMAAAAVSFQQCSRRCGRWRRWRPDWRGSVFQPRADRQKLRTPRRACWQPFSCVHSLKIMLCMAHISPQGQPLLGSSGSRCMECLCVCVCALCLPCAKMCANFSHTSPPGHTHQCTLPLQSLPCQPSQSVITVSKLIHNEGSSF